MILEVETGLCLALQTGLLPLGLKVEAFPDRPQDYVFTHPIGVALVRYDESDYDRPDRTDFCIQNRQLGFEIVFKVRNLRSHKGAYPVLEAARLALQGLKIPLARGPVYIQREKFLQQQDGVWDYGMWVAVPTIAVQLADLGDLAAPNQPVSVTAQDTVVLTP